MTKNEAEIGRARDEPKQLCLWGPPPPEEVRDTGVRHRPEGGVEVQEVRGADHSRSGFPSSRLTSWATTLHTDA